MKAEPVAARQREQRTFDAYGCNGGAGATLTEHTLTFTKRQSNDSFSFVDNPPKSSPATGDEPELSNGDHLTFTADMIEGSGNDVGDLDVSCTVTATTTGSFDDSHARCRGTAGILGGALMLTVGGKAFGDGTTRGAVVGGTGYYAGAIGSFTSSDENGTGGPSEDTLQLFIPEATPASSAGACRFCSGLGVAGIARLARLGPHQRGSHGWVPCVPHLSKPAYHLESRCGVERGSNPRPPAKTPAGCLI